MIDFSVIEYLVRCFGDEGECFVRESSRSYSGAVVECTFSKFKNADAFARYIVREIECDQVRMRIKNGKYIVSVPV